MVYHSKLETIKERLRKLIQIKRKVKDELKLLEIDEKIDAIEDKIKIICLLYTSPSPRDRTRSRMPSSA